MLDYLIFMNLLIIKQFFFLFSLLIFTLFFVENVGF